LAGSGLATGKEESGGTGTGVSDEDRAPERQGSREGWWEVWEWTMVDDGDKGALRAPRWLAGEFGRSLDGWEDWE